MRLKKFTALFLALLTCVMALTVSASAAKTKNSIKLNKTKITLEVGDTAALKATVAKKCTIQWSSSDKSVATVKKGGVVTAKKAGTASITVKIKDTSYKAVCKVTVKKKSENSSGSAASGGTTFKSGQELLDKMTVGWNLGNTFDSTGVKGVKCETAWGNPKTTKEMIDTVKKAGFNTIRIPVSWGDHIDANGKIESEWLDRVQEVVDYAYDNDMYIILNSHHDNSWIKLDEKTEKEVTKKYKYLWQQIAKRFKDYDEKLLFEGRNEPKTDGSAKEWNGGTASERKVLNRMYDAFVDAVRGQGGYNKTRYLIVAPYAATSTSYEAMAALEIPDDERIIVAVHSYSPYNVALNTYSDEKEFNDKNKGEIDYVFQNINKAFTSKGIPVIMDEFGTMNKNNTAERIEIAEYYLSYSEKYGIPCIWWDNNIPDTAPGKEGFGLLNRKTCKWNSPELVEALTGKKVK